MLGGRHIRVVEPQELQVLVADLVKDLAEVYQSE